jgi:nucleotide-binding universal stress UspA family protein
MTIRRIFVPIDFSDSSMRALDYAIDLGRTFGAELAVLFVVEPIYFATPGDLYGTSANLGMLLEEQRRTAREELKKLDERLKKRGVDAQTVLGSGVPHEVIVETAKVRKADLIVMATHGRSGLSHLLMGSVAEKVVRSATCPVLTVRGGETKKATTGRGKRKAG